MADADFETVLARTHSPQCLNPLWSQPSSPHCFSLILAVVELAAHPSLALLAWPFYAALASSVGHNGSLEHGYPNSHIL